MTAPVAMPLVQIAMTVLDPDRTTRWYRDVLGFTESGEVRGMGGPEAAAMTGLPSLQCDIFWLLDSHDFFQLEFFRFDDPESAAGTRAPTDVGYSLIGIHVEDFDAALDRVRTSGSPLGPVLGDPGSRRTCTRDPEGVWVELRERSPLAGNARSVRASPVTTCFIRAVVDDLDRSRACFESALGMRPTGIRLHEPADETLWDARPADTDACVLDAGGILVELVRYRSSTPRPRPAGYRICDQGLLNIAVGSRSTTDYAATVDDVRRAGYHLHGEMAIGSAAARYMVTDQDLSVELLVIPDPVIEKEFGFR